MKPLYHSHRLSMWEAQKYTGVIGTVKHIRSLAHGKPYRMAWRNIFRDKKRAGVVLFSLFLGVTTFLSVTTLVFSTDVSKYIDSAFESDLVLDNETWPAQTLDDSLVEQLMLIPGVENIHPTTWEEMRLDYLHTPLKKCSLTADDGASPPLKWCTNSAEMVHGGRRRGARGRHAGNHSGMPLRLRMDSPSIWMV